MYKHSMMTAIDHERAHRHHKQKLKDTRGKVDNRAPFNNPHVYLRLKQLEFQERKNLQIDKANKNLLERMQKILESESDNIPSRNAKVWGQKSMNYRVRQAEQDKIKRDNFYIARRIHHMPPYIEHQKLEAEFQHQKYLKEMWTTNSREAWDVYNPTPRTDRSLRNSMKSLLSSTNTMNTTSEKSEKPAKKKKEKKTEPTHDEKEEENYASDFEVEGGDKKKKTASKEAKDKKVEKDDTDWSKGAKLPPIELNQKQH